MNTYSFILIRYDNVCQLVRILNSSLGKGNRKKFPQIKIMEELLSYLLDYLAWYAFKLMAVPGAKFADIWLSESINLREKAMTLVMEFATNSAMMTQGGRAVPESIWSF